MQDLGEASQGEGTITISVKKVYSDCYSDEVEKRVVCIVVRRDVF